MHMKRLIPHSQMYDNIASLRFDVGSSGEAVAGALVSAEGEVMDFKKPVPVEGRVEEWMTGVLLEMRRTNRLITKEAIFYYCDNRSRWVYKCACVCAGPYDLISVKAPSHSSRPMILPSTQISENIQSTSYDAS